MSQRPLIVTYPVLQLPAAVFWILMSTTHAMSQSAPFGYGQMWGASAQGSGSTSAYESTMLHNANGLVASSVNAAKRGILFGGAPSITIQSIGAQTVVSTNVYGDNNDVKVDAQQDADNSGDQSTNGSVSATQ